jgi:hypothetical protein
LEGLVVGELDERGFRGEERLVDINLGIDVDGVVSNIEELNEFWLRFLFNCTFSGNLFFD